MNWLVDWLTDWGAWLTVVVVVLSYEGGRWLIRKVWP